MLKHVLIVNCRVLCECVPRVIIMYKYKYKSQIYSVVINCVYKNIRFFFEILVDNDRYSCDLIFKSDHFFNQKKRSKKINIIVKTIYLLPCSESKIVFTHTHTRYTIHCKKPNNNYSEIF